MTSHDALAAKAAILQANSDENQYMVEADIDQLDQLLSNEFVLVHITGYHQSKAEWLEHIESGQMQYHSIREQSVTVQIDGSNAVLIAKNLVDATIWGSRAVWPLKMTTTFALQDGTWAPTFSRATTY